MSCKPVCRICDKIRFSTAVNVVGGNVVINLPAGAYNNNEKYCVVIAQSIPTTATIGANVLFSIGGGTVQYPLVDRCCRPVTACGIRARTRYSLCVETTATSGVFKMLGHPCCSPNNQLTSINGTAPAPATAVTASAAPSQSTNKKEA